MKVWLKIAQFGRTVNNTFWGVGVILTHDAKTTSQWD